MSFFSNYLSGIIHSYNGSKINYFRILITSIFIIFLFSKNLFPQEFGTALIQNFSVHDYRMHPQNWAIEKDTNGILYFGNSNGIIEYDGISWRKINVEDDYLVKAIKRHKSGRIYIGASGSFGYLKSNQKGMLEYCSISSRFDSIIIQTPDIWRINISDDMVYFNGLSAIYKYTHSNDNLERIDPSFRFFLSFDINNNVYVQEASQGVCLLKNDSLIQILEQEDQPGQIVFGMQSYRNKNEIIIATNKQLFLYYPEANKSLDEEIIISFSTEADSFFHQNTIYSICVIPGNKIAVSTLNRGLIVIDENGKILDYINSANGLADDKIWSSAYHDNSLWLALDNGIAQIDIASPFRLWNKNNGLNSSIQDIEIFNENSFLATTKGIYYFNENFDKFQAEIPKFNLFNNIIEESWCLEKYIDELNKDTFLIVGQSGKVLEINKKNEITEILDKTIFSLKSSKANKRIIYGGSGESLYILSKNNSKGKWDEQELQGFNGEIRSIAEYRNELWLGTFFNGVYRIVFPENPDLKNISNKNIEIEHFDTSSGLASNKDIMVYEHNNKLLFATPNGIFSYNEENKKFNYCNEFLHIYKNKQQAAFQFIENKNGDIWQDKLGILYKNIDDAYRIDSVFSKRIPFNQVTTVYPDNDYWLIGSYEGLLKYKPETDYNYSQAFKTLIRQIKVSNDSVIPYFDYKPLNTKTVSSVKSLDYEHNSISFNFTSSYLIKPELTKYSYILEGYDDKWSDWSYSNTKEYTNLFEREYTFKVKAKNLFNTEGSIAVFDFEIEPPPYRTWFAYFLYLLLGFFIVFLSVRLNAKKHIRKSLKLEKTVNERTKEILIQKNKVEETVKQLKYANLTKDKLFQIIAHDLKSPFNTIFGFADLLKSNYDDYDKETRKKFAANIYKASKSTFNLLENLLLWAMSQQGKIQINKIDIPLFHLIQISFEPYETNALNKGISFSNNVDQKLLVEVDIRTMQTAIGNIINNAIKFTEKGGNIFINSNLKGQTVEIIITDTGIGISEDNIKSIFDITENVSTTGTNNEKGTGLGLSISREFVQKNNGKISVISSKKGTSFYIEIPVAPSEKSGLNTEILSLNEILNLDLTFLCITDTILVNDAFDETLSQFSKNKINTINFSESEDYVRKNPNINIVFIDVSFNEADIFESVKLIKEINTNCRIIGMLSSHISDNSKYIKIGFDDFITKPLKSHEVKSLISKYFANLDY